MVPIDTGILPSSAVYFYTSSELARDVFFYPLCTGHFFCGEGYEVERSRYDSFLVFYISDGQGYIYSGGGEVTVHAGEFVLVDCYRPHHYGTHDGWEIYWLHFDGALARRYFEICTQNGPVIWPRDTQICAHQLQRVFEMFHEKRKVNEAEISRRIINLLTEMMRPSAEESFRSKTVGAVDETLCFIAENVERPLTLDELARNVALSPFYFSRLFKKETGYTPHEYIVRARVDKAKYLLKSTTMPLKEIAYCCGFSNECNFSTTFKKMSGSTPLSYRNEEA